MTIALGEFIGALVVAASLGGLLAMMWDAEDVKSAHAETHEALRLREADSARAYSRGCTATRASLRDALTTLPRLHCSRSAAGHVRVADVERLLAEGYGDG